jgi:hypothetical protein
MLPNLFKKAVGDNVPFTYDYTKDLAEFGDNFVTESAWSVDRGSITIGADGRPPVISGNQTKCFIQGGKVGETCVISNSVLLNKIENPDSGDKLVKTFIIQIEEGQYEPAYVPTVVIPNGVPNITLLQQLRGMTPGVSVWVDTTPNYPNGTFYYAAVAHSYTHDGENVIDGQLIQWIEIHQTTSTAVNTYSGEATLVDGYSWVPISGLPNNAKVIYSVKTAIGVIGELDVDNQSSDGFAITSTSPYDNSVIDWAFTGANTDIIGTTGATGATGAIGATGATGAFNIGNGDIGGTVDNPRVIGINNIPVNTPSFAGQFLVFNGSNMVWNTVNISTVLPLTGSGYNTALGINLVNNVYHGAVPAIPAFNCVLTGNLEGTPSWTNVDSLSLKYINTVKITNIPTSIGQVLTYAGVVGGELTAQWM